MLTPFLRQNNKESSYFAWAIAELLETVAAQFWGVLRLDLRCAACAFPSLWFFGLPFLVSWNAFLMVRGYDNRVKLGKYSANDAEQVDYQKIQEIKDLGEKDA